MRRVSVRAIIMEGTHLLCVQHKNYSSSTKELHGDYWCLPGGTIDDGEGLEAALEREIVEELGIIPSIGPLLFIQQFGNKDKEHLEFFFYVHNTGEYRSIDINSTTHGSIELEKIDFIDPKSEIILPEFLKTEAINPNEAPKIFSLF